MAKPEWRRKIENDLRRYKSVKADVEAVETELELEAEAGMGYDYDQPAVQSSGIGDRTGNKAITKLAKQIDDDFLEKKKFVEKLDAYISGLDCTKEYIIRAKYLMLEGDIKTNRTSMTGKGVRQDKRIWDDPEFGYQERRYFELKKEALKELAQKMGYI